jgi:hypothetical protein
MDDKQRCQSCGMPLGEGFYGTHLDGSANQEYCKFCYRNGEFSDPSMTLPKMINLSIENMVEELGFSDDKASELANSIIPQLNRWKK